MTLILFRKSVERKSRYVILARMRGTGADAALDAVDYTQVAKLLNILKIVLHFKLETAL